MTKFKHKMLVNKYLKNLDKFEKSVRELRIAIGKCRSIKKYLSELSSTETQEYRDAIQKEYHMAVEKAVALNKQANVLNSIVAETVCDLEKANGFEKVNQDKFKDNSKMLDDINVEMAFMH
ncbi:MAG: hypothetical protein IJA69_00910 [Clostridia bacterium]|nr:hypothetical protein [Clostridia bacterium]